MILRTLIASDQAQLESLILEFWGDHLRGKVLKALLPFAAFKDIQKVTKDQAKEFLKSDYFTYVVEDNDELVGFIAGKVKELHDKVMGRAGYIENWYVKDAYRKRGVGAMLWKKLEEDFKQHQCTHLLIDTWGENSHARSIYTKKGFIEETIYMVKKLHD